MAPWLSKLSMGGEPGSRDARLSDPLSPPRRRFYVVGGDTDAAKTRGLPGGHGVRHRIGGDAESMRLVASLEASRYDTAPEKIRLADSAEAMRLETVMVSMRAVDFPKAMRIDTGQDVRSATRSAAFLGSRYPSRERPSHLAPDARPRPSYGPRRGTRRLSTPTANPSHSSSTKGTAGPRSAPPPHRYSPCSEPLLRERALAERPLSQRPLSSECHAARYRDASGLPAFVCVFACSRNDPAIDAVARKVSCAIGRVLALPVPAGMLDAKEWDTKAFRVYCVGRLRRTRVPRSRTRPGRRRGARVTTFSTTIGRFPSISPRASRGGHMGASTTRQCGSTISRTETISGTPS